MKILITSGPTREAIDSVRFITNLSTGETGARLADYFESRGFDVIFLHGGESRKPARARRIIHYESFTDLNGSLQKILGEEEMDAVIHAAAVGDYFVHELRLGDRKIPGGVDFKIDSQETIELVLKRNFKILDRIKSYATATGKKPVVIGFKLTNSPSRDIWFSAVNKLYGGGQVDLVVHNDLTERGRAEPRFRLIGDDGAVTECESRQALAEKLEDALKTLVLRRSL